MPQLKKRKGIDAFLPFVLLRFPTGWLIPAHIGKGRSYLLSLLNLMLIFQKHLKNTLRHNVLPALWASLSPFKLTHKNQPLQYVNIQIIGNPLEGGNRSSGRMV